LHAGDVNTFTVGRLQPLGDRPCQYILLPPPPSLALWIDNPEISGGEGVQEVLIERVRKQPSFQVPFGPCLINELLHKYVTCGSTQFCVCVFMELMAVGIWRPVTRELF
jgi:hypothetical protein